jgi:CHASE2 domain-containing sensor protein
MGVSLRREVREALRVVGLAALCALALLAARQSGWVEGIERAAWDGYLRFSRPERNDPRILLLEIRERDIQSLGRWPVPDQVIAHVLRELAAAGASAIGLDIYRDLPVPPGSDELAAALVEVPNVVVVWHEGAGGRLSIEGPEVIRWTDKIGFNDIVLDSDAGCSSSTTASRSSRPSRCASRCCISSGTAAMPPRIPKYRARSTWARARSSRSTRRPADPRTWTQPAISSCSTSPALRSRSRA